MIVRILRSSVPPVLGRLDGRIYDRGNTFSMEIIPVSVLVGLTKVDGEW